MYFDFQQLASKNQKRIKQLHWWKYKSHNSNYLINNSNRMRFQIQWHFFVWSIFDIASVGIEFRRQNLTSGDVRFWRLKSIPAM